MKVMFRDNAWIKELAVPLVAVTAIAAAIAVFVHFNRDEQYEIKPLDEIFPPADDETTVLEAIVNVKTGFLEIFVTNLSESNIEAGGSDYTIEVLKDGKWSFFEGTNTSDAFSHQVHPGETSKLRIRYDVSSYPAGTYRYQKVINKKVFYSTFEISDF